MYSTVANAARRPDPSLPADPIALLDIPEGRRLSESEGLGYNFSPRFKDLNDQRFWRAEMTGVQDR